MLTRDQIRRANRLFNQLGAPRPGPRIKGPTIWLRLVTDPATGEFRVEQVRVS